MKYSALHAIIALLFVIAAPIMATHASAQSTDDEMVVIPGGSFTMGDTVGDDNGDMDSSAPPVTVNVSAFYMGKYEVTKALWDEVRSWGVANGYTDLVVGGGKASNHPVHSISFYDMLKWCNARSQKDGLTPVYTDYTGVVIKTVSPLYPRCNWSANGYRLPTEAEWEKAARGGVSGKRFPWDLNTISHSQANYRIGPGYSYDLSYTGNNNNYNNYHPTYATGLQPYTSPVGSFSANGHGLYDMSGNVRERCWDWYGYGSYVDGATDPRGAEDSSVGRVLRGGSWSHSAGYCSVSVRFNAAPVSSHTYTGFRVARSSVPIADPLITGISPQVVPGTNGKQSVTILGSNFSPDCTVTLRDHRTGEIFPNRTKVSQTPTSIGLSVNFTATPAEWSAEVINPDGKSSGLFRFQVGTPVIPGQTVNSLVISGSSSIDSGDSVDLTAKLIYADGTELDVTNTAIFKIVGTAPEGVTLLGNQLRTTSFSPSTTVSITASFSTSSGGVESSTNHSVAINRGFNVKIFSVLQDDPFTLSVTTSLSEAGGSYTYSWDFNGDDVFNDGDDHPFTTYTYPTMTGDRIIRVRVKNNTTDEIATAERNYRMQKPLAFNQPVRPVPVVVVGMGPIYDVNGEPFEFDYNRIENGFILLTHGLESNGSKPWIKELAQKIESSIIHAKGASALPNIAIYDWEKDANPYKLEYSNDLAARFGNLHAIISAGITNGGYLANWLTAQKNAGLIDVSAPLHFIGHSAGGFVTGQLASNLNQAGTRVDRVTMLDTPMAWPDHLRNLPSQGTYVEKLVTSAFGHLGWDNTPKPDGDLYSLQYYPEKFSSALNFSTGEQGHGLSYVRYGDTATIGNADYLTLSGVSFGYSPFIFGPLNSQRVAFANSPSEPVMAYAQKEYLDAPLASQIVAEEVAIENLTSYGTVQQSGNTYTVSENETSDSGISIELEVPVGAYAVSFLYQFQEGDEVDRLVVSAGENAAQFIMPNLPLYRTQLFDGIIDVAALGQSTVILDFRLDGVGDANSVITISSIKFLISDDLDQDGIPNAEEVLIGSDPKIPDTDGDGLSDFDEVNVYFTNPAIIDTDSDDVTDGEEITDGTDPNDSELNFKITEVSPLDNGDVRITFASEVDRSYRIRGSFSPYGKTNWTIESGLQSDDGTVSIIDTGRQSNFQTFYYWVEVENAPIDVDLLDKEPTYKLGSYTSSSDIADLSAMSVSAGSIDPVFDYGTTSYSLSVAYGVTSTTVTSTASHVGATVKVGNLVVASGVASAPIPLNIGMNEISVEVTAEDGVNSNTYTVLIQRADPDVDDDFLALCFVDAYFEPRIGNQLTLDLARLGNPGEIIKIIGKLPSGLKFNSTSGLLSGVLTGKPGSYPLTIQFLQGKSLVRTISLPITVLPYPSTLIGSFHALLEDEAGVPTGVVRLSITKAGAWSAMLEGVGMEKRSAKGSFLLNQQSPTIELNAVFAASGSVPASPISIQLDADSPLVNGTHDSGTLRGFRMAQGSENPASGALCNLALDAGVQDGINKPAGIGWLTGKFGKTGTAAFKGILGDGTRASVSLQMSATGQALLWLQPYSNNQSFLGGIVTLPDLGQLPSTSERLEEGLWWAKAADIKTLSYPAGFDVMPVQARTSRWTDSSSATLLGSALGWADGRTASLFIDGAGLSNAEPQGTLLALPSALTLDDKFNLNATAPQEVAQVPWFGKVNSINGNWTGTFTLPVGFSSDILTGNAATSGVLLQGANASYGLIILPVSGPKGSFRTAAAILDN